MQQKSGQHKLGSRAINEQHAQLKHETRTLTMTACRSVNVLLPTDVPKAFATSFAPATGAQGVPTDVPKALIKQLAFAT